MITIGIDPGLTGALAMLGHKAEFLRVSDIPVMKRLGPKAAVKNQVNGAALEEILRGWTEDYDKNEIVAFIETPIAFPGQHVATIAAAFLTAGIIEGVLSARHFAHQLVRPADWKKAMGLSADKDQARARDPALPGGAARTRQASQPGGGASDRQVWPRQNCMRSHDHRPA